MGWFRLLLYPAIRIWVGWLFRMFLDGWWIKSCMNGVLWSSLSMMFLWWLPGVGFVFLWFTTSPPPPGFLTDLEISKLDWIAVNLSASNLRLTYWGKTPFMLTLTAIQSWPPYPPLLVGGVVGGLSLVTTSEVRRPRWRWFENVMTSYALRLSTNRNETCRWRDSDVTR